MALLDNHIQVTLNELEKNLSMFKLEDYIAECESGIERSLEGIADRVAQDHGIRAIFISGPSGSGKTTFNHRLVKWLNVKGVAAVNISLDDYYADHQFERDEFGRFDYESLSTLDTGLLTGHLRYLVSGESVRIPYFDFLSKSRLKEMEREIYLPEDGVLLVEGLHGLADEVAGVLAHDSWLGIFLMPYATLTDDYTLLDSRDLRILRRSVRDVLNRGSNALSTMDYWPMLDKAETEHFPAYLANADIYINTAMSYEYYCLAPLAARMITDSIEEYKRGRILDSKLTVHGGLAQPEEALQMADRLCKAVNKIPGISTDLVPEDSILNEFIRKHR